MKLCSRSSCFYQTLEQSSLHSFVSLYPLEKCEKNETKWYFHHWISRVAHWRTISERVRALLTMGPGAWEIDCILPLETHRENCKVSRRTHQRNLEKFQPKLIQNWWKYAKIWSPDRQQHEFRIVKLRISESKFSIFLFGFRCRIWNTELSLCDH